MIETLKQALEQIKYKAVSLADAQVIALEALNQASLCKWGEVVAWMRQTDITELVDTEPETDGWTPLCVASLTLTPTSEPTCTLGCTVECKAEAHGCASDCPALPWQPTINVSESSARALHDAMDRMDALIHPTNKMLTVPSHSITQLSAFADMATIRAALSQAERGRQVVAWVIPKTKQFSFDPQDERFWMSLHSAQPTHVHEPDVAHLVASINRDAKHAAYMAEIDNTDARDTTLHALNIAVDTLASRVSRCPAPIPNEQETPEFTVSDPDLNNLLNLAADMATGRCNHDTGVAWLEALEAVEARLTAAPEGWLITLTGGDEVVVRSTAEGPGAMTLPGGNGGTLSVRLLSALCRALLARTTTEGGK